MELTIEQIKEILPHRPPFLMIDRILDCEPGQRASGIKCVSSGENWVPGHFPQKCVMPGVLILEALAQTGAVAILTESENKGKLVLFGAVKNARFKKQVVPGDVLELECEIIKRRGNVGIGSAVAKTGGSVACTAQFSFAITGG